MNILIVGKNSYIGNHIDDWLTRNGHKVEQLDVLDQELWKSYDYSRFEAIVHVASIVHKPDCHDWELYKRVNADMPVAIATKAKEYGKCKKYIYLSSMAVYGVGKGLAPTVINESTPLLADSMYGKSKLLAEQQLSKLQDEVFNLVFVRPPSVYGKGCRGNYISGFSSIVDKLPIFPIAYTNVKQSMLYIDNLCEFIRIAIENNLYGTFCPQDDKSVSANEILSIIADSKGLKRVNSRLLGILVRAFSFLPIVKKAYGGVEYSKALSTIKDVNYVVVPFDEGMRNTIK